MIFTMIQKCNSSSFTNQALKLIQINAQKKLRLRWKDVWTLRVHGSYCRGITMANSMNNRKRRNVDASQSTRDIMLKIYGNFKSWSNWMDFSAFIYDCSTVIQTYIVQIESKRKRERVNEQCAHTIDYVNQKHIFTNGCNLKHFIKFNCVLNEAVCI